ncbi:DUF6318 family protein [Actinomyces marmotae]|uniref:DUF6318 domain-containing protein n=1 Tax=Actinomyces marmotae TaxID=2737173 RepID=A0A6M8AZ95_9ACTO|nr:DUF6318 family protein [Actinomyces marmotae]QKD79564.1 hypothetical protein HPC72_04250 [Actinomyces marmotae]
MTPAPRPSPIHAGDPAAPQQRGASIRHSTALVLLTCCALAPGLLILTACAKDPTPAPTTPTTPPTQHTTTPAETPASAATTPSASAPPSLSPELAAQRATALAMPKPPMPAEATENTQQGAVRAAVHFIELYRYAFMTGDTTDLAAMSEERCVFCKSAIDDATALHKSGGWANLWVDRITNMEYIAPGQGKEYCGIRFTIISGESTGVNSRGETVKNAAEESRFFMILRYQDGMWHVGGVSLN